MESLKHKLLKQVAIRWLQSTGCVVFASEIRWYFCGIPDAVGIKKNGSVYIVEAKDTTADLRSDYKPAGRINKAWKLEHSYDYDFLYYIVSERVNTSTLPAWVGIINESGRVKRNAKRRKISRTAQQRDKNFELMARKLSWQRYGHVIRGEQYQPEFSLSTIKGE